MFIQDGQDDMRRTMKLHGFLPRRSTIRILVALWAGSALLAWVILVVGWFVAEHQLSVIGNRVVANIRSLDTTRRLESAVLGYRHEDLLWYATGKDDYHQHSYVYLRTAEQTAQELASYVDEPEEQRLWAAIQEKLKSLRERPAVPALTAEIQTWPASGLSRLIQDFEAQNEIQMEESIQAADHLRAVVSYWTLGLAVGTAVLLLGGSAGFMRRVMRPALSVTHAAEAFGRGDFSVRIPVLHEDELGALARTFNNMARDIADREKDRLQFVAMVVHDLKNPVLAIDMAARVLDQSDATQQERRSYLTGIREEVVRLQGIIRDLTDDIQVVNGRFSVHKTEVDLGELVRRFVGAQSKAFATHEIVVKTDQGCTVQADANRISRVVMNLMSNAVNYSPRNTRVTVSVKRTDSQVTLTVSDQGPGIAKEDLKVLFQPFGRGRSADSLAKGTGLGLYVVKQIIEAHGGQIEVHSEPGRGTDFEIRLPLSRTGSRRPSDPAEIARVPKNPADDRTGDAPGRRNISERRRPGQSRATNQAG
jgi:signal transduction histidine kinase